MACSTLDGAENAFRILVRKALKVNKPLGRFRWEDNIKT
jgi:hypothetical protein